MVREIRIYVEGGGDGKDTKARMRRAFQEFFAEIRSNAHSKNVKFRVIPCGGRDGTFRDFNNETQKNKTDKGVFKVLLVDSEGPVANIAKPWIHLQKQDNWTKPKGCDDAHCHLMVQVMETWFIADREQLKNYYGRDFRDNVIPDRDDVEQISKAEVASSLKNATKNTKKGEYHKTKHAHKILESLRLDVVSENALACKRLVKTLKERIDESR